MLHSCIVNAAANQPQGAQAGAGLSSKLVEEGTITQLCISQAQAVKGREGVRDEMSAA
jgi:hypothetical protein